MPFPDGERGTNDSLAVLVNKLPVFYRALFFLPGISELSPLFGAFYRCFGRVTSK
jgi:hypothetical protein